MVQITGKYKRTSIENFEEFLNEVGVGVLLRKAALASTPTMEISKSGEKWKMVTSTILKVNTGCEFFRKGTIHTRRLLRGVTPKKEMKDDIGRD